jgi:periplasmic mercuric ion binding protein
MMAMALAFSARAADVTVKITDVHICCQSCVKGIQTTVAGVQGVTAAVDQEGGTVTLTAADSATVQQAADALVAAGFYGKSSDAAIKINADTGAKGVKVQSLKIKGVHLCCGHCVQSLNDALSPVPGVKANTAKKGAESFEVTGDFKDKDVFDALQKAGFTGKVE